MVLFFNWLKQLYSFLDQSFTRDVRCSSFAMFFEPCNNFSKSDSFKSHRIPDFTGPRFSFESQIENKKFPKELRLVSTGVKNIDELSKKSIELEFLNYRINDIHNIHTEFSGKQLKNSETLDSFKNIKKIFLEISQFLAVLGEPYNITEWNQKGMYLTSTENSII